MSADGEIDIAVRAEGTDEAAAELSDTDGGLGGGGGGDDDGGEGGLGQALSGGIFGGLIAQLLGPILDVLNPILDILKAFLAPVAVVLLRALAPVLREFLKLLPGWSDFVSNGLDRLDDVVQIIRNLPGMITAFLRDPLGTLQTGFRTAIEWLSNQFSLGDLISLTDDVLRKLQTVLTDLSDTVADAIADGLRRFFSPETGTLRVERDESGEPERVQVGGDDGTSVGNLASPIVISGGLSSFVENIESSANVELF